ncbi:MAG: hypothetical protein ACOWWM_17090 [Desulfobacterales bacterium]
MKIQPCSEMPGTPVVDVPPLDRRYPRAFPPVKQQNFPQQTNQVPAP